MKRLCIIATLCVVGMANASAAAPPAATPEKKPAAVQATKPEKKQTAVGTTATAKGGVRTIDAINIEGEIVVPQVLFITSRDNRRYRDGLAKNFRMGTLDVVRGIDGPR